MDFEGELNDPNNAKNLFANEFIERRLRGGFVERIRRDAGEI